MDKRVKSTSFGGGVEGWLNGVSAVMVAVSSVVLFLILSLITFDVVARYFFHGSISWALEISTMMFVFLTFGGLGYATIKRRHIATTFLAEKLAPPARKWLTLVTNFVGLIVVAVFTWQGYVLVSRSFRTGQIADESYLLIPVYIPQVIIPVGLALFWLVLAMQFYKRLKEIRR